VYVSPSSSIHEPPTRCARCLQTRCPAAVPCPFAFMLLLCCVSHLFGPQARKVLLWHAMIPKKLVLELAKGFRGRSKNCISIARERVEKALQYAYRCVNATMSVSVLCFTNASHGSHYSYLICVHSRDRRVRRRDLRSQWIQQINAGTVLHPFRFCL
jgi:ribosomal protein L20